MPATRRSGCRSSSASRRWNRSAISAGRSFRPAAALIAYVDKTQIAKRPPIEPPRRLSDRETMRIDAATRANLELFRSTSGGRAGTLLCGDRPDADARPDRGSSPSGWRARSADPARIEERLDARRSSSSSGRSCAPAIRAALVGRAGHAARAVAARARPRRPARSRHDPRRPRGGRNNIAEVAECGMRTESGTHELLRPVLAFAWTSARRTWRRRCARRSPTICRS